MSAEIRKAMRRLLEHVCGRNARRHLRRKLRAAWNTARGKKTELRD
jgi:hypothetical protein